ncbi:hypothetical protein ACFWPV_22890 [Streptomyces uncialis]|uniref:hypothetical protein n=1 Tax=Streptomyces uncialis TaxID=1048205 RepID=UPI0036565763
MTWGAAGATTEAATEATAMAATEAMSTTTDTVTVTGSPPAGTPTGVTTTSGPVTRTGHPDPPHTAPAPHRTHRVPDSSPVRTPSHAQRSYATTERSR